MFRIFHSRSIPARSILVVLVSLSVVSINAAFAATTTPLVVVSGTSPFAKCTFGSGPGAINYTNAEVEPYVAVNPANPQNLIGAWQQDRWNDGGSHGLVAGYSMDGGKPWKETPRVSHSRRMGQASLYCSMKEKITAPPWRRRPSLFLRCRVP